MALKGAEKAEGPVSMSTLPIAHSAACCLQTHLKACTMEAGHLSYPLSGHLLYNASKDKFKQSRLWAGECNMTAIRQLAKAIIIEQQRRCAEGRGWEKKR